MGKDSLPITKQATPFSSSAIILAVLSSVKQNKGTLDYCNERAFALDDLYTALLISWTF